MQTRSEQTFLGHGNYSCTVSLKQFVGTHTVVSTSSVCCSVSTSILVHTFTCTCICVCVLDYQLFYYILIRVNKRLYILLTKHTWYMQTVYMYIIITWYCLLDSESSIQQTLGNHMRCSLQEELTAMVL